MFKKEIKHVPKFDRLAMDLLLLFIYLVPPFSWLKMLCGRGVTSKTRGDNQALTEKKGKKSK